MRFGRVRLKWGKRTGLRAGYDAVIAVLVAEVLDKGRGTMDRNGTASDDERAPPRSGTQSPRPDSRHLCFGAHIP
jgi:hypothetical protein